VRRNGFDAGRRIPTPGTAGRALSNRQHRAYSEDMNAHRERRPNAVVADLDGDGFKRSSSPLYDGKVQTTGSKDASTGAWPLTTVRDQRTAGRTNFRFASEPVVVDLDNERPPGGPHLPSWPRGPRVAVGPVHAPIPDYLGGSDKGYRE